jgi:uncharacterized protein YbjT (DUF2867 family)
MKLNAGGAMHFEPAAEAKVEYTAMLLGAAGNVGGHILHLLMQSLLWKRVVVVTRRNVAELANPKVHRTPRASTSRSRLSASVRVARRWRTRRAMMTAVGADSQSSTKYLRNIGDKEKTLEYKDMEPFFVAGDSDAP